MRLTSSEILEEKECLSKLDRSDVDSINVRPADEFIFCLVSGALLVDTVEFRCDIFIFPVSSLSVLDVVSRSAGISISSSSSSSFGLSVTGLSNSNVTRSLELQLSACQLVVWRNFLTDLLSAAARSVLDDHQGMERLLLFASYTLRSDSVSRVASAAVPVTETHVRYSVMPLSNTRLPR